MTEKTEDATKAQIFTDFADIFGKEHIIELTLDVDWVDHLHLENAVYVEASTVHKAKLALAEVLVLDAHKLGVKRVGQLATQELARQREDK